MKPLKIIAELYNGFASSDDWSPTLDGILAYWMLYRRDPDVFLTAQGRDDLMAPVEGLPLERVQEGDFIWWACSSPMYELAQQHRQYFHRRFDDQHERFLPESVKSVVTAGGAYKNYRKSMLFRVTRAVSWHCIGDRKEIEDLLALCHHIGGKPAQGYGRVKQWHITQGENEWARYYRPLSKTY